MKVKVPKQIKIGSHSYKVIYRKHLSEDEGYRGCIGHRLQEMWIDPVKPLSQRNATLLHEVLHLISVVFSASLDDDTVDRTSEGFAELLFNNLGIELDWSDIEEEK